ncbi:MAG: DUF5591 domain-containing protein [Nanoarchaeota archaeon]|nr:DUF5591 domain-containing protein [Nanoarchaeota archaeon]
MTEKTLYLNSGKCSHAKCVFCGWGTYEYPKLSFNELKEWFDTRVDEVETLKIFNSGSFLDNNQVDPKFRKWLIKRCEELEIKNLVIESRPEFVTQESLNEMKSNKVHITVAIGLEVADNEVLKNVNKGFTVEDYLNAAKILKKNNFGLRSYVLVNIPFETDESLEKSIKIAKENSDSVVIINWFPHGYSPAFNLWLEGKHKPLDKTEFEEKTKTFTNVEKDFDNFVFKPLWPKNKQRWINGATEKELKHPYYEIWQDFIVRFYKNKRKNVLFVPCAFRKPYTRSKLHKAIRRALFKIPNSRELHLIVISSPGVIPYEFADKYPFNKYDWKEWEETPEIKQMYIEVNQKRIENYLQTHKYEKYFCYLRPDSESYKALHNACDMLGIKIIDCISDETFEKIKDEKNALSLDEPLEDLKKNLVF